MLATGVNFRHERSMPGSTRMGHRMPPANGARRRIPEPELVYVIRLGRVRNFNLSRSLAEGADIA